MIKMPQTSGKIEFALTAKHIPNTTQGEFDSYVMLETITSDVTYFVGETESIKNELNPIYSRSLIADHFESEDQVLKFSLIKEDSQYAYRLGIIRLGMRDLLSNVSPKSFQLLNPEGKSSGISLEISWEKVMLSDMNYTFSLSMENIYDVSKFTYSHPYFKLFRPSQEFIANSKPESVKRWIICYQSENHKEKLTTPFIPVDINKSELCRQNEGGWVKIEIWDYGTKTSSKFIGSAYFTISLVKSGQTKLDLKETSGEKFCNVQVSKLNTRRVNKLGHYLEQGLNTTLTVAVDFTASNGPVKSIISLHHVPKSQTKRNEYEVAMQAIGNSFQHLQKTKGASALGFGAKIGGRFEDYFTLSSKGESLSSIDDLLQAYRAATTSVELFGPSNLAPMIKYLGHKIKSTTSSNKWTYHVILVLTDGILDDVQLAKQAIADCKDLPMSIVIIGIGNEDFSGMKAINDLERKPRSSRRDICSFFRFRSFAAHPDRLALEIHRNLEEQIDDFYFKSAFSNG